MFKRAVITWGATLLVLAMTVSSAWSAPAAQTTPSATPTPVAVDTFDPAAAGGRTVVKWYVGLGTGGDPKQIDIQRQQVDQFNKSQNRIYVALQIVDNRVASTTLATQIAAGNVPDIVGPVGTVGRASFEGNFLDLTPYIASNGVDVNVYDPAVVNAYNYPGQGQIGLPFAVFPSFVYYNKDLFDEAGLPYPPQNVGELYQGREWNFETVRDLAKKLTVDDRGNDATSPDFAPDRIVQFGWDLQFGTDPRAMGTPFGAGRLVDDGGRAQIPANWLTAWNFFYDGMFREYWMPNDSYRNSDLFGKGSVFNSGHLAMAYTHLWYTCCLDPVSKAGKVKNWDIGVVPSYNGVTTAKLHADTFVIMKATQHPDEAFEVYRFLINNGALLEVYGAMPAIGEMQAGFFRGLNEKFAPVKVNWQVAINSLAYPDVPNHEETLPNQLKARQATIDFQTLMNTTPGLDINAEAERLQATLQGIYEGR
ncbi:MAG TPA: extracellular solute-binding protein [Chloroflexota bacterium]|jgi:multiple sugar transport system substrate-binding protein